MRTDPIRRKVTALSNRHYLTRIEFIVTPGSDANGVTARAYPDAQHPEVEHRNRVGLAKHQNSSIDLRELNKVYATSLMPVARARGHTVEGALKALEIELASGEDKERSP